MSHLKEKLQDLDERQDSFDERFVEKEKLKYCNDNYFEI